MNNPSSFLIPNEKPTFIDAIGMAGDLTIYGRRDNVMLIRDNEGQKEITRLNLDSSKVLVRLIFTFAPMTLYMSRLLHRKYRVPMHTETEFRNYRCCTWISYRIISKTFIPIESVVLNMQVKDFMDKQSVFNLFR